LLGHHVAITITSVILYVLLQILCLAQHCLISLRNVMTFLLRQYWFVVQRSWRNDCRRQVHTMVVNSGVDGRLTIFLTMLPLNVSFVFVYLPWYHYHSVAVCV